MQTVCKLYWGILPETEVNWQSNYNSKFLLPTDHAGCQLRMVSVTFFPKIVPGSYMRQWQRPTVCWELTEQLNFIYFNLVTLI